MLQSCIHFCRRMHYCWDIFSNSWLVCHWFPLVEWISTKNIQDITFWTLMLTSRLLCCHYESWACYQLILVVLPWSLLTLSSCHIYIVTYCHSNEVKSLVQEIFVWDFRVVFINATREYESTVFYYSSYILWQNLVPCMLYTLTILYQRSK